MNMKFREYFFIALIVAGVCWFMTPNHNAGPSPENQHPIATRIVKLAKWLGWAALFADSTPPTPIMDEPPPMDTDSMPLEVVNEEPKRETIDGVVQIQNREGW